MADTKCMAREEIWLSSEDTKTSGLCKI